MAKAKKKTGLYIPDPLETRRWCIEQAVRWPIENDSGYGLASGGGGYKPRMDVDLLGRADKILAWISK